MKRPRAYISVEVAYGEFPDHALYHQIFGESCLRPSHRRSNFRWQNMQNDEEDIAQWLQENNFIFAPDERCRFVFDMGALVSIRSIGSVKAVFNSVGEFARNLRVQGGFFFFREAHNDGKVENRIFNGTEVFTCGDDIEEALPTISQLGESFSKGAHDESWRESALSSLKVTYRYVKELNSGGYEDPHLRAPWRRLWYVYEDLVWYSRAVVC